MNPSVMIAGCGIGGATLAIALLQRGFDVRIFERTSDLKELGAGLTLQAGAMRVFDALGIWPQVRDITALMEKATHLHYQTGEILTGEPDEDWLHRPETPEQAGHTHRGLMHSLLIDTIRDLDERALVTGARFDSFDQDADGVTARFADGRSARADILVGAEGLGSAVRAQLWPEDRPSFTGIVAFRCMIDRSTVEPFVSGGRCVNFTGPGRSFLRYGVRDGTQISCVGLARTDRLRPEGWENRSSREEVLRYFGNFHADVLGLLEHAPDETFFKWALHDCDPLDRWSQGRVTLLGDAAHPMLPYHGMGASQAIEDAMVLARALDSHATVADAFAAYERVRIPHTTEIVLASRAQGAAINSEDPHQYGRLRSNIDRLKLYNAATAPI